MREAIKQVLNACGKEVNGSRLLLVRKKWESGFALLHRNINFHSTTRLYSAKMPLH